MDDTCLRIPSYNPVLLTRVLAAAVCACALAGGCDQQTVPSTPAQNARRTITVSDPQLKAEVERITQETLGRWNEPLHDSFGLSLLHVVRANPPLKTPSFGGICGNSYGGVFGAEVARDATRRLFAAYGFESQRNVKLKGNGYAFVPDGYDPACKVGFVLLPHSPRTRLADQVVLQPPAEHVLEPSELAALSAAVKAGEVNVFVADARSYPKIDGDLFSPMRYYLASVVDYLNWVNGDGRMELNKVFGKLPGGSRKRGGGHRHWPELPGADFENDADLERWSVTNGKIAVTREWSSFGERGLRVDLDAGGEVTYTPPGGPIELTRDFLGFACDFYCGDPAADAARVTVALTGEGGELCRFRQRLGQCQQAWERADPRQAPVPFRRLVKLTISTDSPRPVRFYVDDVALYTHAYADGLEQYRQALEHESKQYERQRREHAEWALSENERIQRAFDSQLPAFDSSGVLAQEAFAYFAERLPATIRVDWGLLGAVGVGRRTPVVFRSDGGTVRNAMRALLEATGARLTYQVTGGVVRISTANGVRGPRPYHLVPRGTDLKANRAAERQMHRRLPNLDFCGMRLDDAFQCLQDACGVKVVADWPRLEGCGLRRDALVELQERQIDAEGALLQVLLEIAVHAPLRTCVWDGVLVISTEEAFADPKYTPPGMSAVPSS